MPRIRGVPDWALYAGGGVALGGAYLLYKRRKSASATTAPASTTDTSSLVNAGALAAGAQSQQSSIVPYYLTGGQGRDTGGYGGRTVTTQGPPLPVPSGPAGQTNVSGGSDLGSIPPILPNVNTQTNIPQPAPSPSVASPTPAPAPAPGPANLDPALVQKINAAGEQLIGNLIDPLTGGTWWFGNKGGVFAVNGARYLGSVPGSGATFPGQVVVQAIPLGTGYRLIDSQGHTYNYGG